MKVVFRVALMSIMTLGMCSSLNAATQNDVSNQSFDAQRQQAHQIFQNMYYKAAPIKKDKPSKIKQTIRKLKNLVSISLGERMKLKVSSVKAGPLDQSMTQLVDLIPNFQTPDEGSNRDTSNGYGIKFTYSFD